MKRGERGRRGEKGKRGGGEEVKGEWDEERRKGEKGEKEERGRAKREKGKGGRSTKQESKTYLAPQTPSVFPDRMHYPARNQLLNTT